MSPWRTRTTPTRTATRRTTAPRRSSTRAQYDKAEPYLWCVVAHCEERDGTAGAACPTASVGLYERDECESAVFNYLGFVSWKKDEPDFETAEEYYREALELWPEDCDHQRPAAATIFESF